MLSVSAPSPHSPGHRLQRFFRLLKLRPFLCSGSPALSLERVWWQPAVWCGG